MKKIGLIFMTLLMATVFTHADNDIITQDASQLPAESRQFINDYFPGIEISRIKIDRDNSIVEGYDVLLMNGTEIEFKRDGQWKEIDGNNGAIPMAVIPNEITDHIRDYFGAQQIIYIDKDVETKVKLMDHTELTFGPSGRLIEVDD